VSQTVMSYVREGNRRSGIAIALCHRLHWFMHLRAQCQMSSPARLLV